LVHFVEQAQFCVFCGPRPHSKKSSRRKKYWQNLSVSVISLFAPQGRGCYKTPNADVVRELGCVRQLIFIYLFFASLFQICFPSTLNLRSNNRYLFAVKQEMREETKSLRG
jgi:hypothetical protein